MLVDLTKAFDRVRLQDVTNCLRERDVPSGAIKIIQDLNSNNSTIIRTSSEKSKPTILTFQELDKAIRLT